MQLGLLRLLQRMVSSRYHNGSGYAKCLYEDVGTDSEMSAGGE